MPRGGGWVGEREEGAVWEGGIDGPAGGGTMGASGPGPRAGLGRWRQVHSRGARAWRRAGGHTQSTALGGPQSKEPGSRWRCRARERPGRRRGFGAGQEGAERRQG